MTITHGDDAGPAPSTGDFEQLLSRAQAGDASAVTRLYQVHQPLLLRYIRAQEPRVADDLAADVWLAVVRSLSTFSGDEAGFRGWLFTIAKRRVIEHRRRGLRRRTDVVDPDSFLDTPALDDPATSAVADVSAQEAIDVLTAILSPVQAEVLILRIVAELDAATVARIMGRDESWVRVTQHRALKRLAGRSGLTPN